MFAGNTTPNFTFEIRWVTLVSNTSDSNDNDNNETQESNIPTKVSTDCIEFIIDYETFRSTPYDDGSGNITIGYGHVIRSGESFTSIDEEQARSILLNDIIEFERSVTAYLNGFSRSWLQYQYDAFVSLAFNAGKNFKYVVNDIVEGKDPRASFEKISKSQGTWLLGLWRRRMDEADMFIYGTYNRTYRTPALG